MQLGMVGLGRMGGNMTERCMRGGHDTIAALVCTRVAVYGVRFPLTRTAVLHTICNSG